MVDAGAVSRGLRFRGLRALVVLHQGEIDLAVGHVTRKMIAGLAGLGILEAEDLLVEVAGAHHVVDLQRDMDDTVHRWCSSMRKGVPGAGNPTGIIALAKPMLGAARTQVATGTAAEAPANSTFALVPARASS